MHANIESDFVQSMGESDGTAIITGASQPHLKLTFPCLDLKKLSEKEKQQLCNELYADSVDIMNKFQEFFSATTKSLKERNVSVVAILCHLVGLGSLKPTFKDQDLPFRCQLPGLKNAKSIDDVMFCIGDYCSFFNSQMLERIVDNLGTDQDKVNLSKYREEFREYAERHVFKCPSEVGKMSKESHAEMFIKLDDTYENCTVGNLHVFVRKLQDILKTSAISGLKLCHIEPGCLKLTFQLPFSVLQDIFPLSSKQEANLAGLGVDNLWLIYQFNRQQYQVELELARLQL